MGVEAVNAAVRDSERVGEWCVRDSDLVPMEKVGAEIEGVMDADIVAVWEEVIEVDGGCVDVGSGVVVGTLVAVQLQSLFPGC